MSDHDDPTIEAQLDELKQKLEDSKNKIKEKDQEVINRQKELEDAKAEQKALAERIAALERATEDITKVQDQVTKMRDSLGADLDKVSELCESVTRGLARQLAPEYLNQIARIRGDVDASIAELESEVADLRKQVKPAETSAEAARKLSRDADSVLARAQDTLRSLPAEIQAAKAELMRIKSAMESAYSKDLLTEAYLQVLDLEQSLDKVTDLAAPNTVNGRVQTVEESWTKAKEAKAAYEKAARDLETLKAGLAKKEKEAQDAAAKRKTDINTRVDAIGQPGTPEPEPAAP